MKRLISLVLAIAMVFGVLPVGEMVAFAEEEDREPKFTKIEADIKYTSTNDEEPSATLTVRGKNFTESNIKEYIEIPRRSGDGDIEPTEEVLPTRVRYELKPGEFNNEIVIDGETISLRKGIPKINNIYGSIKNEESFIYKNAGEDIVLEGSDLTDITKENIEAKFVKGFNEKDIKAKEGSVATDTKLVTESLKNESGTWDIIVKNETTHGETGDKKIDLTIRDQYLDIVTIVEELGLGDNIKIIPNIGPAGGEVTLQSSPGGLRNTERMSVFFIDKFNPTISDFKKENKGDNISYENGTEKKVDDKFLVKVPKGLSTGKYYVFITNYVTDSGVPQKINQIEGFKNNEFIVSTGSTNAKITNVIDNENRGEGTAKGIPGSEVKILGSYIGEVNEGSFELFDNAEFKKISETKTNKMLVEYQSNSDNEIIGNYTEAGADIKIKNIRREIEVIMSGAAKIIPDSKDTDFEGSNSSLRVEVPTIALAEGADLKTDVELVVKSYITIDEKDTNGKDKVIIKEEKSKLENYFTFITSKYKPDIKQISPSKIHVDKQGNTINEMTLNIDGDNFFKYEYTKDGVTYPPKEPEIRIVGEDGSDKWFENIRVLDGNGKEVDGRGNNLFGKKIKVDIKKGVGSKDILGNQMLEIINPLREDSDNEVGRLSDRINIEFVDVTEDKTPTISTINPDTVTTDGQKGVVITGQKFFPGVKVYIDGEEIKNIERNDTGDKIIFDAPPKSEGYYQIIVQNEEGGTATYLDDKEKLKYFTYTKTYTDPKILDFNPKKGAAKTLVTVKGQSFVLPNPLVSDLQGIGINKLIGTRVKLGGQDVNIYKDGSNVPNGLHEDYKSPSDNLIIRVKDGKIEGMSDYYHSVILKNGNTYYTIYFDTKSGEIKLSDGDKEVYVIGKIGGEPIADLDIKDTGTGLSIGDKNFTMETPYEVKGNVIIGNRVKVINNNELVFEVPPMPREGFYDVTVVNPDTKSDSKTGVNGFYYSFQPAYNPEIESIEPDKGSIDGGYYITITAKTDTEKTKNNLFKDDGTGQKTKVTIGSVVVDPKDVEVSIDGKELRVKVPKYPGNLENETDMDRKSVNVVITNPDGGTGSKKDGFTYIIPISHPKINRINPNTGSAAGGETVYIEGSGFRFYEPYKDLDTTGRFEDGDPFEDLNDNNKWDDLTGRTIDDLTEKDKNILPKVYFGGELATIKGFSGDNQIEVETPKGLKGTVDVYVVNNDQGISNTLKYTYNSSSPKINRITPNVGKKQGGDKVEIIGSDFHESDVRIYKSTELPEEITRMQLVQFGDPNDINISNKNVKDINNTNFGNFSNDKTKTIKIGNFTVRYENGKLITKTKIDDKEYEKEFDYDKGEVFIPIDLIRNSSDETEYVRIKLEKMEGMNATSRLRIDRGFSPQAKAVNSGQIELKTPSYYSVGKVPIIVTNPDGGTSSGDFEYKNPDSNPTITNILRDGQEGKLEDDRKIVKVNVDGGNTVDILGTDFRKPVKIKISDLEITQGIEYDPSNEAISQKMTFTMPKVDDKYVNEIHRLVIENEDGGTAGSDDAKPPVYIQFIKGETTGLEIIDVDPKAGPSEGGTEITITGKDFRKTMDGYRDEKLKVYFGKGKDQIRVPDTDIISVSIDKIVLRTPAHAPGTVSIKVENPDGSITEKDNAFTYVSNPKITNITDKNGTKKQTLFIDGGEELTIKGNDFMEGARVIFNPMLKESSKNPDINGERIFIEKGKTVVEYTLESGTPGTDVEFIDSSTIKVKTPAGKLDTGGVIVINPDNAATPEYDIKYTIEDIDHPQDVRASLIQDEYIRINWNEVIDKATTDDGKTVQYEVYAVEGNSRQLIGSTGSTGFVFRDIKPNTTYKFLVRAVGKYGSSKPISESMSNEVRTGRNSGPKDEDGKPGEQTTVDKTGDTANVVIGEDAFKSTNEYVIDLTRGTLAGSDKAVVSMSAKVVVNERNSKIKIVGKDYSLSFSPNVFENSTITSNKNNQNAGVKFEVSPVNTNFELNQNQGDTILSSKYNLRARVFVSANSGEVENLNGKMNFILDYDENMVRARGLKNIKLVKYDVYDRRFKEVFGNSSSYGTSIGDLNELGTYMITGSRR